MLFGMMKSCARTYADLSRLYWRGSTLFNLDKVQKPLKAAWGYICPALSVFLVVVSVTPPFAKVDVMNARSSKPFPEGSRSARSGIGMICGIEEVGWLHISLVGGLEHQFYVPIYWVSNHPNWLIFFRGVRSNHQPGAIHLEVSIVMGVSQVRWMVAYFWYCIMMHHIMPIPQMLMLMWNGLGCPGDTKKYRKTMGIYA